MATSLDATFFAFRKREKSGVLLGASVGFTVGMIVLLALFLGAMWGALAPMIGWYGEAMSAAGKNPEAMATMPPPAGIFMLIPATFLFLVFYFILLAAYEAACLKWMIRGESSGLLGLSLSADTWRVYATYWVWFGTVVAAYIGLFVVVLVTGAVGGLAGGESKSGAAAFVILGGVCAYLVAWLYAAVRLAPAAATSIGRGRFSFFSAWSATRGRFWALFGAFLLLIIIFFIASLVISSIFFSVVMGSVFANLDWAAAVNDPTAFQRAYLEAIMGMFANPTMIALYALFQLVNWALTLCFYVMFYGVNARAVVAALEEAKIAKAA